MSNPGGAKEVPVKQTAIVVSVLAVGWLAIQFALKPFLNKKKGSSGSDKSEPDAPAPSTAPSAAPTAPSSGSQTQGAAKQTGTS